MSGLRVLFVITGFAGFTGTASAQSQPTTYAITHAKIFTLSGATIDDGTIVIQNGKIANVGAAVEVPAARR